MAFSLDDVQREIKTCATRIDTIRRAVPTRTMGQKDVPVLIKSLIDMRDCANMCESIGLSLWGNVSDLDSIRRYVSKIRQLSKLANSCLSDIMGNINSLAGLEVNRLKYNETMFQWLPPMYSLMDFSHRRAYWTYALNPESDVNIPTYSLYYRVDFASLRMLDDVDHLVVREGITRPFTEERVEDKINPRISSESLKREASPEGYRELTDKFISRKMNDNTFTYVRDMTLWIRPTFTLGAYDRNSNVKLKTDIFKSGYPMMSPLMSNLVESISYGGATPLQQAQYVVNSLGAYKKSIKKLARFNTIAGNSALWTKL